MLKNWRLSKYTNCVALAFVLISGLLPSTYAQNISEPTIIGGEQAAEGAWPWMASLQDGGFFHSCGGTLIDPSWVVTAAHCVYSTFGGGGRTNLEVLLGSNSLSNPPASSELIMVSEIIIHEGYNPSSEDNDIALLKLAQPSNSTPIPGLAVSADTPAGKNSTVIGWGNTSQSGFSASDWLMQVVVPLVSDSACESAYPGFITDNMLCAGLPQGGKDSCQGDSGGPLMVQDSSGKWVLAGIVSWGEGCALPEKYGVYTRVSQYINWINSKVGSLQPGAPAVSMKANGSSDDVTVASGTTVDITLDVSAGNRNGELVDYWFGYLSPFGNVWMDKNFNLVESDTPVSVAMQPLVDIGPGLAFSSASLDVGFYLFFFIIDTNPNGILDDASWFGLATVWVTGPDA